ncbi:hypothetical protein TcWFU_007096 [Taenia crassiceps]|uniref:Uncharacterized protein n=1 Tax=Taenia crassiceps TaxID=6207 RepID=A0ABR4Q1M2_9CEST
MMQTQIYSGPALDPMSGRLHWPATRRAFKHVVPLCWPVCGGPDVFTAHLDVEKVVTTGDLVYSSLVFVLFAFRNTLDLRSCLPPPPPIDQW